MSETAIVGPDGVVRAGLSVRGDSETAYVSNARVAGVQPLVRAVPPSRPAMPKEASEALVDRYMEQIAEAQDLGLPQLEAEFGLQLRDAAAAAEEAVRRGRQGTEAPPASAPTEPPWLSEKPLAELVPDRPRG
jgi:hypothetical protein